MREQLKLCPICHDIWTYCSNGDYYSGYESEGYRVNCQCGLAWSSVTYQKTIEQAVNAWNAYLQKSKRR